jgi:hypothetical protein
VRKYLGEAVPQRKPGAPRRRRVWEAEGPRLEALIDVRVDVAGERRRAWLFVPADVCSTGRIAARKENSMQRMMSLRRGVGVLAGLVALAGAVPVYAQTGGMERRDERQDDRGAGRAAKQDCKAGDEKTRAECRQEKRDTKHGGAEGTADEAPAAQPPAAQPAP